MSERFPYFAYGSNMSTRRLQGRVRSAKPIGPARLPNRRLVCNKKSKDDSGKANLVDSTGDTVCGVLYDIAPAALAKLDEAENGYTRTVLEVITDQDSSLKAYVYVSSELTEDGCPYDWYKKLMIEGAREHGLPAYYVKYLEGIPSRPNFDKKGRELR